MASDRRQTLKLAGAASSWQPLLPHPVSICPMGSHGLVHPEAEVATAQGGANQADWNAFQAPQR